jgi:signal transduction histidine kinase
MPGEVPSAPLPPPVIVEEIRIDDQLQEPSTGGALALPPGKHACEFRFTAPSFVAPEKIRFQWRLDGAESEWVDGGSLRQARYPSLGPGRYTFRVRAGNSGGAWNGTGTPVVLTVAPHYWQTLWFRILAPSLILGLAASLLWLVLRRRHLRELETMNRMQLVQAERTRIARDLHDDLGASLTQLTWLCEAASDRSSAGDAVEIAQIGAKSREMVRSIDEIVWAVSPHNDTLDALAHYICQFAEDFLRNTDIRCRLDVDESLPEHSLKSAVRHDLFLAAREAIHNAARHSDASELHIDIHASDARAEIRISDDGCGFDPDRDQGGNGMRNMQARAAAAGASFILDAEPGKGSSVTFAIQLNPGVG